MVRAAAATRQFARGASRSFYTRDQVNDKRWLTTPPTAEPLTDIAARIEQDRPELSGSGGRIHHWLLPAAGWGATSESKEAKELVPDRVAKVKAWRKAIKGKPTKKQLDQLVAISHQAEELWAMAYRRLKVAEEQSARRIPLWGCPLIWRTDRPHPPSLVNRSKNPSLTTMAPTADSAA
nr:hypothetical protein [Tessaracoccus coleopterorum]